jgi:hypothetical protein
MDDRKIKEHFFVSYVFVRDAETLIPNSEVHSSD